MKKLGIFLPFMINSILLSQEIMTEYVVENGDTLDVFSYQIPENYDGNTEVPLLVAFHQWGGTQNSNYFTQFDEECNARGWIMMSPFGGSSNNYNHQGAQYYTQQAIIWMMNNYTIDADRVYMVGGSMGGAGGAIFASNHLDPELPMVAATASGSGILDCERRYWEMDGNNSMIQWFGGTPEEVPFEYHRNSAVFFMDSTQSMHYNLQHIPLYLDFGADEPHRYHAEDLYNLLLGYNPNMWIETEPGTGHGYVVMDEEHVCDWLSDFTVIRDPGTVNVALDEPSRAYWCKAVDQNISTDFIRLKADRLTTTEFTVNQYQNSDSLIIFPTDLSSGSLTLNLMESNEISVAFELNEDVQISSVQLDNQPYDNWDFQPPILWINRTDAGTYVIDFSEGQIEDVNGDGVWNVLDIVLTVNFITGMMIPDEYQQTAADLNDDGVINVLDIVMMVNLITGQG
ncbi:MAG: dockerin type I domain-containing protein [Fidelibacterota bacterium]